MMQSAVPRAEFDALKRQLDRVTEQLAQLQGIVLGFQPLPSPSTVIRCVPPSHSYYRLAPPFSPTAPVLEQLSDEQALKELQNMKGLAIGPTEAKIHENAWLERFLHAAAQEDVQTRNKLLLTFSKDFIRHASTRARIILQEMNVPTHKKSILPLHVGGTAGGTKYLDDNILFKFADDPRLDGSQHLYGGQEPDFERAAKAAANELKGANAYFQCLTLFGRLSVIVPPEVLLDFNGFRLIAMPWLPLGSAKLVYGSADQGRNVHDDDFTIRAALKFAAHHLHLAPHRVQNCVLFTAGDVEGHQDSTGRFYLIDLARTFPPEDPDVSTHLQQPGSSVFFRFHRPEFMAWLKNNRHSSPLSSDSFTMWGHLDAHFHNNNARAATEELVNVRIPEVVAFLCSLELVPANLGKVVQQWGISLRHLGLIRALVRARSDHEQLVELDLSILSCMVRRCCKNLLRQDLREAALSRNVNDTIASFLNDLVHQSTEESLSLWTVKIPKDVRSRFGAVAIVEEEESKLAQLCQPRITSIAKYVCMQLGISLTHEWQHRFSRDSVLSTSVRAKTFGVLASLLHEDSVEMACASQTSNEFIVAVTKLWRTGSDELDYLIDNLEDDDKVEQIFCMHCDSLTLKNVNLGRLAALTLHFHGRAVPTAQLSDQWLLALVTRLPQIFSPQQVAVLMTERLTYLCHEQKTQLSPNAHALVVSLVNARADPNVRDEFGDPLLFKCMIAGNESMVESLLECRAFYEIKDGFGKLLDNVVTSYYLSGSPQYLIRQALYLKGVIGSPLRPLPPVRLRVHSVLINNGLQEGLDLSTLRFRVKLSGGDARRGEKPNVQQKSHMHFVGNAFTVHEDFYFEHWPDVKRLNCVITHGSDVLATLKLQRPSQVFSSIRAPMTAPSSSPPASVSPCASSLERSFSFGAASPSSASSGAVSPSSNDASSYVSATPTAAAAVTTPTIVTDPFPSSPFTLVADLMYVAPEAKLLSLSSSNMAYFKQPQAAKNSILLLGAARSGKTTLFKRMCCLPFSLDQKIYYGGVIRRNVVHGVKCLIQEARARIYDTLPESVASIGYVEEIDHEQANFKNLSEVCLHLSNTLADPGIKKTLANTHPLHVERIFFPKIARIFTEDYVPSDEDVFACYEQTCVISEAVTESAGWHVSDVGGSKLEQRKWLLLYPNASCVFFTVNLCAEFEEGEGNENSAMAESCALWESVLSHSAFSAVPFVLIFTFDSMFRTKLSESALRAGGGKAALSYDEAVLQLSRTFLSKAQQQQQQQQRTVHVHFVDLLEDASCNNMLKEIEQAISPPSSSLPTVMVNA